MRLPSVLYRLARSRHGATALEYAFVLGLISVAVIAALGSISSVILGVLNAASGALT